MSGRTFLSGLLLLAALGLTSCTSPAPTLPVYDNVPSFVAVDSSNRPFTRDSMKGEVWVVDFIYTNCPAACPMMSSHMRRLVIDLKEEPSVRFLSISVDPARDTPEAMALFSARYGGANERWRFITAQPDTVHLLAYTTFHVGDVLGKIEHSTKFMTVDRDGRIRGYYSSTNPEDLSNLKRDVRTLAAKS